MLSSHKGLDLAVRNGELPDRFAPAHSFFHDRIVLYSDSVVTECTDVILHPFDIRNLRTLFSDSQAAVGMDVDDRLLPYKRKLLLKMLRAVRNRREVRHGTHVGVASAGCRERAGSDRLLVGEAGLTEVHVYVYKSRENIFS